MAKFLKDLDNCSQGERCHNAKQIGILFYFLKFLFLKHSKTFLSDKDINLLLTFPFYVSSFCLGNPTSNFCGWLVCGGRKYYNALSPSIPK